MGQKDEPANPPETTLFRPTMNQKIFFHPERCLLCLSCVLACQMNSLGARNCRSIPLGERPRQRISLTFHRRTPWAWKCQQCTAAPCSEACVSGSLRRKENGAGVENQPELCVGCGACLLACPLSIPIPDEVGKVSKCNLCPEEEIPPCVRACQSRALVYQDVSCFSREKKNVFSPRLW